MDYPHYPVNCKAQKFWDQQADWSQKTFGSDQERGPLGPLKHLEKEAREAQQEVTELDGVQSQSELDHHTHNLRMEITDCLFLTMDAARRAGMSLDDLLDTAFRKLEINKNRTWSKPTSDEPVEHIRD